MCECSCIYLFIYITPDFALQNIGQQIILYIKSGEYKAILQRESSIISNRSGT